MLLIGFGIWIGCVIASYFVARDKGRNTTPFVIVTILFGVFGLLWAIFADKQDAVDARPRLSGALVNPARKAKARALNRRWRLNPSHPRLRTSARLQRGGKLSTSPHSRPSIRC